MFSHEGKAARIHLVKETACAKAHEMAIFSWITTKKLMMSQV